MMVIIPFSRPHRERVVLEQWHAQTIPHTLLILRGQGSAGAKRNLGMQIARDCGEEWVVFADDDNYYGPRYLEDFARVAPTCDVATRGMGFVRSPEGLWEFPRPGFFPGHSTGVRLSIAPDMPDATGGEEVGWSRKLRAAGARVAWLPPWGLVYDRTPRDHGYDASWAEFLRAAGPARGPFDVPDVDVNTPAVWKRIETTPQVTASDESIFQSLEARAARRLGRAP